MALVSSNRKRTSGVRFSDGEVLHELPPIDEEDKENYWHSPKELQRMFQVALLEISQALDMAARQQQQQKNGGKSEQQQQGGGEGCHDSGHTLRGLEPLSQTCQQRKKEAELERIRVIQAYNIQMRLVGRVNEEEIRDLYMGFSASDIRRAIAHGKMDAQDSYCFVKPTKKKGMFSRVFKKK